MSKSNKTIKMLEENLQYRFVFTYSSNRIEIRDIDSKSTRIIGYIGIALLFPIWTFIWLTDNFLFWLFCLKNRESFKLLSFTSYNDLTPYHMIGRIGDKIKLEICSNDHPPPHFHVYIDDKKHSFRIEDCEHIKGGRIKPKIKKEITNWYSDNRESIINKWNETRISNCQVGEFRDNEVT